MTYNCTYLLTCKRVEKANMSPPSVRILSPMIFDMQSASRGMLVDAPEIA